MSTNSTDSLIKKIKAATGLNQEEIATKLNYSRAHFSVMKKDSPEELAELLKSVFSKDLAAMQAPLIESENEKAILSAIRVLIEEVAKLKVKSDGKGSIKAIMKSMAEKANLELDEL